MLTNKNTQAYAAFLQHGWDHGMSKDKNAIFFIGALHEFFYEGAFNIYDMGNGRFIVQPMRHLPQEDAHLLMRIVNKWRG